MEMEMDGSDFEDLRYAKRLLERPSLAARLTDALGAPIETGFKLLPGKWSSMLNTAVHTSLERALNLAVRTLGRRRAHSGRERFHKVAVTLSGATGGAFGLPGLAVELPVSTTLMLRAIADIGLSEGEDLAGIEARLACLEVFALGGKSRADDAAETGYFAVRSALAGAVTDAARYITQQGVSRKGAPALVRLISAIGARFGIVVSEKVAAMAVPAIGAAGGALVNSLFISHFQDMARGHFIVRRLERKYGPGEVREIYDTITI